MSKDYERIIVERAREKLGPSPTIDQVVRYLFKGGAITPTFARLHVVREDFFRIYMNGGRLAIDVENEVGEDHNLSGDYVRKVRSRVHK